MPQSTGTAVPAWSTKGGAGSNRIRKKWPCRQCHMAGQSQARGLKGPGTAWLCPTCDFTVPGLPLLWHIAGTKNHLVAEDRQH